MKFPLGIAQPGSNAAYVCDSWAKVLNGPIADVRFHPKLSTRAVAGSLEHGQAFFTTNGGRTWKQATHATPRDGRVELAYSAKNPNIVYASVEMQAGDIWRSVDGGKTYARRGTLQPDGKPADYLGDQGSYGNAIWAGDPRDENLVVVGGINLWRSTDGGDTLREVSTWWESASVHADHHAIVSHPGYDGVANKTALNPNNPNRILAGGLSLWQTTDAKTPNTASSGPRWRAIRASIGQEISAIAIAAADSALVWVGHAGGAIYKTMNSNAAQPVWQRMDGTGPQPLVRGVSAPPSFWTQ